MVGPRGVIVETSRIVRISLIVIDGEQSSLVVGKVAVRIDSAVVLVDPVLCLRREGERERRGGLERCLTVVLKWPSSSSRSSE